MSDFIPPVPIEANASSVPAGNPNPNEAAEYRAMHRNRMMVFTKLKTETPASDEFCRIRSVETLAPGLWITGHFLDGSIKRFRPEKIRFATEDEERLSTEIEAGL